MKVRVGSRRSALARVQSDWVIARLGKLRPDIECAWVGVETEGDRRLEALPEIGGKGLFTQALEAALERGEVDLAVHSYKDLPTRLPEGFSVAAVTERADAADVLISKAGKGLFDLPPGAVVGTSSLRRAALIAHLRGDLRVQSVRGNVDTRLKKMESGQVDALVLAAAGLSRSGLLERVTERLDPETFVPAPGQGALALEVLDGRPQVAQVAAALDDAVTRLVCGAERAFLEKVGSGCQVPLGAFGRIVAGSVHLTVFYQPDGEPPFFGGGSAPLEAGARLAGELFSQFEAGRGASGTPG